MSVWEQTPSGDLEAGAPEPHVAVLFNGGRVGWRGWENWQSEEVAQSRRVFDPKASLAPDVAHATPVQPQPVPTVQAAGLADHATERRLLSDLVSIQQGCLSGNVTFRVRITTTVIPNWNHSGSPRNTSCVEAAKRTEHSVILGHVARCGLAFVVGYTCWVHLLSLSVVP